MQYAPYTPIAVYLHEYMYGRWNHDYLDWREGRKTKLHNLIVDARQGKRPLF